jgi:hypothetical protein
MSERGTSFGEIGDEQLEAELRALAAWLDDPWAGRDARSPDPARRARQRIEAGPGRPWGLRWLLPGGRTRPIRRGLVLALIALVVLAAIAAAIGLGVPGIRIIFTGASPSPSVASPSPSAASSPSAGLSPAPTSPGPPGSDLGLGFTTTADEAAGLVGFDLLVPRDPSIGPPDAIWTQDGRVSLVWKAGPRLPETQAQGIGLLLTEFRGRVGEEYFGKMIEPGTTLTPVTVGGSTGYWISGALHVFVYLDPQGEVVPDNRRVVGNTLLWTDGPMTLRLETSLGREGAIRIAESVR